MLTGCGRKDDDSINKELKFEVPFSPPRLLATLMALVESSRTWSSRTFIRTFWGTFILPLYRIFQEDFSPRKRAIFRDDTTGSHLFILRRNQSWRREMFAVSQAKETFFN